MASPSETPSSPKETPAESNPGADAAGQPSACEQRQPPAQPTTPPALDEPLLPQPPDVAQRAQELNDNDRAGVDIGNTSADPSNGVETPAPWVSFPSSPPRPEARLTPSPTPSEMELERARIANWRENEQPERTSSDEQD